MTPRRLAMLGLTFLNCPAAWVLGESAAAVNEPNQVHDDRWQLGSSAVKTPGVPRPSRAASAGAQTDRMLTTAITAAICTLTRVGQDPARRRRSQRRAIAFRSGQNQAVSPER